MIDYIVLTVILVVIAFNIGKRWERARIMSFLHVLEQQDAIEEAKIELANQPIRMNIIIESNEDGFFAYGAEDNNFLAHASNADALLANLVERFPNHTFAADDASLDILMKNSKDVTI